MYVRALAENQVCELSIQVFTLSTFKYSLFEVKIDGVVEKLRPYYLLIFVQISYKYNKMLKNITAQ